MEMKERDISCKAQMFIVSFVAQHLDTYGRRWRLAPFVIEIERLHEIVPHRLPGRNIEGFQPNKKNFVTLHRKDHQMLVRREERAIFIFLPRQGGIL